MKDEKIRKTRGDVGASRRLARTLIVGGAGSDEPPTRPYTAPKGEIGKPLWTHQGTKP
ncbi:hypothetical protein MYX84_15590 [Acidobacteria bacterium AH-259-O06]|nr:hypothetical protein [Acidobacteria bacterium AH-259-O06]